MQITVQLTWQQLHTTTAALGESAPYGIRHAWHQVAIEAEQSHDDDDQQLDVTATDDLWESVRAELLAVPTMSTSTLPAWTSAMVGLAGSAYDRITAALQSSPTQRPSSELAAEVTALRDTAAALLGLIDNAYGDVGPDEVRPLCTAAIEVAEAVLSGAQ